MPILCARALCSDKEHTCIGHNFNNEDSKADSNIVKLFKVLSVDRQEYINVYDDIEVAIIVIDRVSECGDNIYAWDSEEFSLNELGLLNENNITCNFVARKLSDGTYDITTVFMIYSDCEKKNLEFNMRDLDIDKIARYLKRIHKVYYSEFCTFEDYISNSVKFENGIKFLEKPVIEKTKELFT